MLVDDRQLYKYIPVFETFEKMDLQGVSFQKLNFQILGVKILKFNKSEIAGFSAVYAASFCVRHFPLSLKPCA